MGVMNRHTISSFIVIRGRRGECNMSEMKSPHSGGDFCN
ncbi:hypothetical protein CSB69_2484 [Morganella morganii]|nr:hypothetical protein CSB69_2484 [Morganella morganii]EMP50634.1 hypothetical protein C790_02514 [Morganella morganii SC01]